MARLHDFYYVARTLADYRSHGESLHSTIRRDRSLEITVLRILDQIYSEEDWRPAKQRIRTRVYAKAYLNFANRYFGAALTRNARRCYLKALTYRPDYITKARPLRRFLATYIGQENYRALKAFVHSLRPKPGQEGR